MSTRSITTVKSRWEGKEWKTHAVIYRHSDGYLSGHGAFLADFLQGLEVINGIPMNPPPCYANGPGQLAAQLVWCLQMDGADPHLESHTDSTFGQEFHYEILVDFGPDGGDVTLVVYDGPVTFFGEGGDECTNEIFRGTVLDFLGFLEERLEEDE